MIVSIWGIPMLYWYIAAGVLVLLLMGFFVLTVLAIIKQNKIVDEVLGAELKNVKINAVMGFYPEEEKGSFGKEKIAVSYEEDDSDINTFMISKDERQVGNHMAEPVIDYVEQIEQVMEYNPNNLNVGQSQTGGFVPPQHTGVPTQVVAPGTPPPMYDPGNNTPPSP